MDEFLRAMAIFKRYRHDEWRWPFHCEHEVLYVCGVRPADMTTEALDALSEMGFDPAPEIDDETFRSFRYGSC